MAILLSDWRYSSSDKRNFGFARALAILGSPSTKNQGQIQSLKRDLRLQVEVPMYTKLVFIFGFLTAIILAEPVSCETVDRRTPGQALCGAVQSAADQTRLGADANARLREAEINSPPESELPAAFPEENATRAGS